MKNKMLPLPLDNRDIKARVNRRYIISIVITVVWCAAVFAGIYIYGIGSDYVTGEVFLIATIVIPICVFRPHRIILDRSWTGVVQSVERNDKPRRAVPIIGMAEQDQNAIMPAITLNIKRSDGKTVIKEYKVKKDRFHYAEALVAYYNAGTAVYCYRGVKYLKKESNSIQIDSVAHRLCIVCGNFCAMERTNCQDCRSTFVD